MPSYSPVFSTQLILYTDAAPNLSFLVPDGFTAVVRDFSAQTNLGGVIAQLFVQNDVDAPLVCVAQAETAGVAGYDQWQGRVVAPAGATLSLELSTADSGTSVYVGGYLLRNTLT